MQIELRGFSDIVTCLSSAFDLRMEPVKNAFVKIWNPQGMERASRVMFSLDKIPPKKPYQKNYFFSGNFHLK